MFSAKTHPIAPRAQRGIQLKDPHKIKAYNTALVKQLEYHSVFKKLEIMNEAVVNNSWSPHFTSEYIKLDNTITESMISAEQSIVRRGTNTFDWSVTLAQSVHSVQYWTLCIKQAKHMPVSHHLLQMTHKMSGLPDERPS
jgi:hypothetical protein